MSEHPANIVELPSSYDFSSTLNRLSEAFENAGLKIFARIDHSAAAAQSGLNMPPTVVLIYGNPSAGTPLMLTTPTLALDLPMRVLVREHTDGQVFVAYHPAPAMTNAVILTDAQLAGFAKAEALIAHTVTGK